MATFGKYKYTDIILEIKGQIGIIKFNRPQSLNAFGGNLLVDAVTALRELNEHPETVFTVITGEGRFFSSGADVRGVAAASRSDEQFPGPVQKKLSFLAGTGNSALELQRSMIDHKKVLVLALNGPAVGGGAAWFQGVADIILAADNAYLQVPFSALGLVPEFGSSTNIARAIGVRRANDFLMFGRKLTAQELEQWGLINRIFPVQGFHGKVVEFLEEQLSINDGKSMMEAKRLQNLPLRAERLLAVYEATDALAERFVEDAPKKRFAEKNRLMQQKSKAKSKL